MIELRDQADEAPVVKLVHSVIADAVRRGASDIHFEPRASDMRVRYRIDGVVMDTTTVPRQLVAGLISRVKIMANLDIAERRVPQDGRIGLSVDGRHVDLRVATLPVVRGESIVMRILDKDAVVMDLDVLGMGEHDRERFEAALHSTHGAILVTGPTGSGKTTTLYAGLNTVNTPEKTIITVEDPVEYELTGVKQVQVNPKTGLTFAAGLRSMVRADPDIIMVGEVRDKDTALIAIESALTGHLVLTTLHTNDAPLAAARLVEMGIEPYLVASGVDVRRRPAPGAPALRLQGRGRADQGAAGGPGVRVRQGLQGLRAGRLRALQPHRLPRPARDLRGHAGQRGPAQADPGEGLRRRHARATPAAGHEHAARGRPARRSRKASRPLPKCCAWPAAPPPRRPGVRA